MLRAGKAQSMHDEVIGLGSWQGFGCVSCVSIHLHVYYAYLLIKEPQEQEVLSAKQYGSTVRCKLINRQNWPRRFAQENIQVRIRRAGICKKIIKPGDVITLTPPRSSW